jgi:GDP-L-fucose synthase
VDRAARIFVAGHRGLVGSAILRRLEAGGHTRILTRTRSELDLTQQAAVQDFFASERPDFVFLAAARVGGIAANSTFPAEFIRENLLIQTHVIDTAWRYGVRKLLFLGSSCVYPKFARQPISEDQLLAAPLEPTNEPYAVAKIAGIRMCQAYHRQYNFPAISLMPTNVYGPEDNFDAENSHVLAALLRRFHEARQTAAPNVTVWGSGRPRREFLHVDDLADAAVFLMERYDSPEIINVGTGSDLAIAELADMIREIVGYPGEIVFDPSRPDGTPRKLLDVSRLSGLGWRPRIGLREGIEQTYEWYRGRTEPRASARGGRFVLNP